ncbi:MAG: hypothetical protein ABSD09_17500 [Xanthobacteraceae bacterium]|jgi:hypothetical protein
MDPRLFVFLIAATALETVGDAVVRLGLMRDAWLPRAAFFAVGAAFLFGYGLSLNLAPVEFSRVVGLYIAILFVMWQVVNLVVFHDPPAAAVIVGGVFIVFGGALVTFWR